jgi:hypothetical protein
VRKLNWILTTAIVSSWGQRSVYHILTSLRVILIHHGLITFGIAPWGSNSDLKLLALAHFVLVVLVLLHISMGYCLLLETAHLISISVKATSHDSAISIGHTRAYCGHIGHAAAVATAHVVATAASGHHLQSPIGLTNLFHVFNCCY